MLCVALALVGAPALVLLDEPTAASTRSRGGSCGARRRAALRLGALVVVLCTHLMEEADALAARVAVMASGRVVALGSPQRLKDWCGVRHRIVACSARAAAAARRHRRRAPRSTLRSPRSSVVASEAPHGGGGVLVLECALPSDGAVVADIVDALEAAVRDGALADFSILQPSLEQVFLRVIGESIDTSDVVTTDDDEPTEAPAPAQAGYGALGTQPPPGTTRKLHDPARAVGPSFPSPSSAPARTASKVARAPSFPSSQPPHCSQSLRARFRRESTENFRCRVSAGVTLQHTRAIPHTYSL